VHYCGVVPMQRALQLALLEEVRDPEPPIRLSALFYEPGSAAEVAAALTSLGDLVVGIGGPTSGSEAQELLAARGVPPVPPHPELERLVEALGMPVFAPDAEGDEAPVPEGAYQDSPLFETNADGVFYALKGRRLPAKRHPYGMQLRIEELAGDRVTDESGDLWHRRIEELDAIACALCAHRYAVGHAYGLGAVVLPGSDVPDTFSSRGVLPPVERITLPRSSP
jgi:hypothetical protein